MLQGFAQGVSDRWRALRARGNQQTIMLLAAGDTVAGPNDSFTVSATLAGWDIVTITGIITNEGPRPLFPTRDK